MIVIPLTSVDRAWPHHVPVVGEGTGLAKPSFAMTEQPRTISTSRITRRTGTAEAETMQQIDRWLQDFLGIGPR